MSITHTKVVAQADDPTAPVGSGEWNDVHVGTATPDAHAASHKPGGTDPTSPLGGIVDLGPGSAVSNDAAALAAGAALVAAIAALPTAAPNPGGVIQLGRGFYTLTASGAGSQLDFRTLSFITLQGVGGASGGGAGGTVIETYRTDGVSFVLLGDSVSIAFKDLQVRHQSSSYSGSLIDCASATLEANYFRLENCIVSSPGGANTSKLLNLNQSITSNFVRVNFDGGGIQVYGKKGVPISAVSVANPTHITATAHGYTTGQYVTIGGISTTPAIASPDGYQITVIDANTFSIAVNVTNVAVGTGFAFNQNISFSNAITFQDCLFIHASTMPIWNPGQAWTFLDATVEPLRSGAIGFMGHDAGNYAKAVSILDGWWGDSTTSGQQENWITFSGSGFTCRGVIIGGSGANTDTAVVFDDLGVDGWEFSANHMDAMYRDIDFTTVSAQGGLYAGNGHSHVIAGWASFKGTIPLGKYIGDNNTPTRPVVFMTAPTTGTVTAEWWDADANTVLYRASAGSMFSKATYLAAGYLAAGQGGTAGTKVFGGSAETVSGTFAQGSNANIDNQHWPKGTGIVNLNPGGATSGASRVTGQMQLPIDISPTQLAANTNDWAPTSLAFCSSIRIDLSAAWSLTGIVAQPDGTEILLHNKSAFALTLIHDATSTAANRFYCPGGVNFTLRNLGSVLVRYDSTISRWLVVAA